MKKLFQKGLIALLPMVVTIFVLYFVLGCLYAYIGMPLGDAMRWVLARITGQSAEELEKISWFYRSGAPLLGLFFAMVLVFFMGGIVATLFGKNLLQFFEKLLEKTPVIGVIYPYAKQFTEFFSSGNKVEFKNAVAIPFPTYGIYSVAFVTGDGMRHLSEATKKQMCTVFVPTAPTPFTGYVCYVPREDVIPLPITVDEALRIIISCGVLAPSHQTVSLADFSAAAATQGRPIPLPSEVQGLGRKRE